MSPETEKDLALKMLSAWKADGTRGEVPWHITDEGWLAYANHPDEEIRIAAIRHPYYGCPSQHLQRRRNDYRLDVMTFS